MRQEATVGRYHGEIELRFVYGRCPRPPAEMYETFFIVEVEEAWSFYRSDCGW